MSSALRDTTVGAITVPWLSDPVATAFKETLGESKDAVIDTVRHGVKMRWTSGAKLQAVAARIGVQDPLDDATLDDQRLRLIGDGFDLPRLGTMSAEAYQSYLDGAWDTWGIGGTASSIVAALQAYGVPDVEIVEEYQDAGGTWANPGGYGWRFCIILGPNYGSLGWTPQAWPLPLDGRTVFGIAGMTPAQLADIAHLARKWKIGASLPVRFVFRFGNASVFGVNGCPFPLSLDGPDIAFDITAAYFTEDGIPFPLPIDGPSYIYG